MPEEATSTQVLHMRQVFYRISHIIIFLFVFTLKGWSQANPNTTAVLSLDAAVAAGLENNFGILIAKQQNVLLQDAITYGNAGLLPTVTATALKSYTTTNLRQDFNSSTIASVDRKGVHNSTTQAGVNLNWTIFNGLGMFINYQQLQQLNKAGRLNALVTIENAVASIKSGFYNVAQLRDKVKLYQTAVAIATQRAQLAQNRYDIGSGSKQEVLNAQVDVNTDRSALLLQQLLLQNAVADLNQVIGRDPNTSITVLDSISPGVAKSYEAYGQLIKQKSPAYLQAVQQQNLAYLSYKATESMRYPVISFQTGYNYNNQQFGAGLTKANVNSALSYGLAASFNIFNGFNQHLQEKLAKENINLTAIQTSQLALTLETGLYKTWLNYQNNLILANAEKDNMSIAKQNVETAFTRYKVGVGTSLDFREAQRSSINTETRHIDALYQARLAEIELDRLVGGAVKQ